jgi:succinate-acetate transporter protein
MDAEDKVLGRVTGEQDEPATPDNLLMRLVFMVLIALMMSVAYSVLGAITLIQFVIMVLNKRQPNERLAEFGTVLGIWFAKAVRYQTAASEVKPFPWTELD